MDGILDLMVQLENTDLDSLISGEQPLATRAEKRKRGGQKGNSNARTHGFYSKTLSEQEVVSYNDYIHEQGIDPEIAILRVKMETLFREDPYNAVALDMIIKQACLDCQRKFRLTKKRSIVVDKLLETLILDLRQHFIDSHDSIRHENE